MTRERKAQIATAFVLVGTLTLVAAKRGGWRPPAIIRSSTTVTPQETVYRMMDAARDGDVRAYLASYTGALDASLRQIVKEKGEAALADYIRRFNAAVKGMAIQEPQPLAENEMRLRVEFIYRDHNELQTYYLQRSAGGWRIERQENTEGVKVLVPYGTPVE